MENGKIFFNPNWFFRLSAKIKAKQMRKNFVSCLAKKKIVRQCDWKNYFFPLFARLLIGPRLVLRE